VSANPEPLAPIFDAILIGEVDEVFSTIAEVVAQGMGIGKDQLLAALAQIPGVYVPQLHSEKSAVVERQWAREVDTNPAHSVILTPNTEFSDMYLIEIARGCRRGCRFCLAGFIYRPPRERSVEALLDQAREGLRYTDRIGLVASSVSCLRPCRKVVRAPSPSPQRPDRNASAESSTKGSRLTISSLPVMQPDDLGSRS